MAFKIEDFLPIDVTIKKESVGPGETFFVIESINYNLVAQGKSLQEAMERFYLTLFNAIALSNRYGTLAANLFPKNS